MSSCQSYFADSNRSRVRIIPEVCWAVTPSSGLSREVRIKTSKVSLKKDTKVSDEIRADRMVPSIIEVGANSEGEIDYEFSAGAIDNILAAFCYGAWSRPMTMDFWEGNVGVADTSHFVINSATDFTQYLTVGRFLKGDGFLNKANNGYFQIVSVSFASGQTLVQVSTTALVAEAQSPYTRLYDANDLMVSSSAIRLGTTPGTIDSNGQNLFASLIAAGQIVYGQKIYIDGLGIESGTVTFAAQAMLGDTLQVGDGVRTLIFEFNVGSAAPGNALVSPGASAADSAQNLVNAIALAHAQGKVDVYGTVSSAGVVTIENLEKVGGTLIYSGTAATATAFAGGDASKRGIFTVVSAASDVIGVSPAPTTDANAAGKVITVRGSMLRNPAAAEDFVPQSFTLETGYEDINQYMVNKGMRVGTFDLDVKSKDIIGGKYSFKGEGQYRQPNKKSLLGNAPFTALQATPGQVTSATVNVGSVVANGAPIVTALKSISITGDAGLRDQDAVGSKFPVGIGAGRFKLSGKMQAYFEDGELFDQFINHDTTSIGFPIKDLDGQVYFFSLPAIKLTSDPVSPGAIDQDVMEDIDFEAFRDPNTNCMFQVDRFSAVRLPVNNR